MEIFFPFWPSTFLTLRRKIKIFKKKIFWFQFWWFWFRQISIFTLDAFVSFFFTCVPYSYGLRKILNKIFLIFFFDFNFDDFDFDKFQFSIDTKVGDHSCQLVSSHFIIENVRLLWSQFLSIFIILVVSIISTLTFTISYFWNN